MPVRCCCTEVVDAGEDDFALHFRLISLNFRAFSYGVYCMVGSAV